MEAAANELSNAVETSAAAVNPEAPTAATAASATTGATSTASGGAAKTAEAVAATKPTASTNTGQNQKFSLAVKSEYIVSERPASLGPLPPPPPREDDKDGRDSGGKNRKKGKRNKKKRPRDARLEAKDKMCLFVVKGEICPHDGDGTACKFSHDISEYMRTKAADITTVDGGCPHYRLFGKCRFGLCCRFSGSHVTKDGTNLENDELVAKTDPKTLQPLNAVDRSVLVELRKRQYDFKCQRHDRAGGFDDYSKNLFSTPCFPLKEKKAIDWTGKVYVAPLTTVGNLPFRRIMKQYQADITCGEMAIASCLLEGKHSEWSLVKRHHSEDIFGVQIASGYADQFSRVCEVLEKHVEMDFVDLNLGCPLDMICEKGAGAALMKRDKRLQPSLMGICNTLSCPITIKVRTGWDDKNPMAHELIPKVSADWGLPAGSISAFFVHGRSRLARYSRDANWDYISKVAKSQTQSDVPKIPVIGNGDIFSFSDYEEKVDREGINATAMLARGALIKPWLPTEIKERRHWDISASERLDMLKDFVKHGLEHWGSDDMGVNLTRRFLLEWCSFLHRYVPVGLLERVPQVMNHRPPPNMVGRNDLETLFLSPMAHDWIKISEMLLGPVPEGFQFEPKHKSNAWTSR